MQDVLQRLEKHVEALPGYRAWLAEADRDCFLGVLRSAALKHLQSIHCTCGGKGRCEHCQLDEALAHTAERGGAVEHEEAVIDLAALQRESERPLPAA